MQVKAPGAPHLSYCTNIHPAESLAEVISAVELHVPAVKARLGLGVEGPFGVGLRLSARAARELDTGEELERFRDCLNTLGLYVFTINGFPYGAFHGTRVKEAVYRPDWLEEERVNYSGRLARILAALSPPGCDGSISTVPGAFRARAPSDGDASRVASHLLDHGAELFRVREETAKLVEIALEPEPCCFLETSAQTVRFFQDHVFSSAAVLAFSKRVGISTTEAGDFLRRHVSVCLDACHLAVEFEDANDTLSALEGAGIRIGKVQITTALALSLSGNLRKDEPKLKALERFSDGIYLHQVVERRGDELLRHLDLPDALALARAENERGPSEWRVHFHVPVFSERFAPFSSTRPYLEALLATLSRRAVSAHLEVETYTWDVLPPEHRSMDVDEAIARELEWTLARLVPDLAPAESVRST